MGCCSLSYPRLTRTYPTSCSYQWTSFTSSLYPLDRYISIGFSHCARCAITKKQNTTITQNSLTGSYYNGNQVKKFAQIKQEFNITRTTGSWPRVHDWTVTMDQWKCITYSCCGHTKNAHLSLATKRQVDQAGKDKNLTVALKGRWESNVKLMVVGSNWVMG